MLTIEGPCCAHQIVRLSPIPGPMPGTHMDAWACCDCGAQFAQQHGVKPMAPGPSHLHDKLAALRARVAELEVIAISICAGNCLPPFPCAQDGCPKRAHPSAGTSREA